MKREWKKTLLSIQESSIVSSPSDGEEFICRMCEIEDKPCVENPLVSCPEKLLGGTELQAVGDRYRSLNRNEAPRCMKCGKMISARYLNDHPLGELCTSCRGMVKKVKRGTRL